jgi:hypothetical protein
MKQLILVMVLVANATIGWCQLQITEPDKSPLDISYHPHGYPILKFQSKTAPTTPLARVIYSRPQKNGRVIFGDVVKYNEVWRMGANESTELEFFRDVTIGGKKILKGRYTFFCVPQTGKWTVILNSMLNTWGTFSYDKTKDVLRTDVPISLTEQPVEYFTMVFDASGNLVILWDTVKVSIPITYAAK